jgi:hypothetical protein
MCAELRGSQIKTKLWRASSRIPAAGEGVLALYYS